MRRILAILFAVVLSGTLCNARKIFDSGYATVGFIKPDGTAQDSGYRTVGHIKSDGTIQDSSYKTIGHARDVPMEWAALCFFFKP